ncbi:DUF4177 domain-containing protein [Roseivivax sediminis]|uniref:DUF4177 domain-containing protein n=1 Tax=Roseivivax sediminis TaxID=936889 RepID=A0A1I2BZS8_9RHOB|nr:DUF4177 domain-containing protein [Roseivivax sediminis]SFE61609.1 hypothetical protein SAMN04515678_11254 [Roseivivax sediminis]
MPGYEYKVVPAPTRGEKAKGVKGNEARFALAVERLMNDMAETGWDYQRAETLPSEERSGLTASVTVWRTMLVFRRARAGETEALQPRLLEAPGTQEPAPLRPAAGPAAPGPTRGAPKVGAAAPAVAAPMVPQASGDSEPATAMTQAEGDSAAEPETAPEPPEAEGEAGRVEEIPTLRPGPAPDKPAAEASGDNGEPTEDADDLSAVQRARAGGSDDT